MVIRLKMKILFVPVLWIAVLCIPFPGMAGSSSSKNAKEQRFFIIDSWLTGYISGFFSTKEHRFKTAWQEAKHRAGSDARIWGGLCVSDTNRSGIYRCGELLSRFTYQAPQTAGGFVTAHFYNTVLGKVNKVEYAFGATVLNMDVSWPGVALGNYILAKPVIEAKPDNRMFQHEYGHYLQSKRMGLAYFVRVGLPAIMSKGDHDAHPVEIDCNREGFLYFNKFIPGFQNDTLLADGKGWNFYFNPFPDSVGVKRNFRQSCIQYVDYKDSVQVTSLQTLKVRAKTVDYAGWILVPAPAIIGCLHARYYNRMLVPADVTANQE